MTTDSTAGTGLPLPLRHILPILLRFALTRIELQLFGLHRLLTRLGRRTLSLSNALPARPDPPGENRSVPATDLVDARAIAAVVRNVSDRYAARRINCLVESIVLVRALHRRGIAAELKLGIRTITGRLQSHAWVEYDDKPLNDEAGIDRIYDSFDLPGTVRASPPDGRS